MYIYIFIYMCVYVYICKYVSSEYSLIRPTDAPIYVFVVYICLYVCTYICVCMYVCTYMYIYVYIYVFPHKTNRCTLDRFKNGFRRITVINKKKTKLSAHIHLCKSITSIKIIHIISYLISFTPFCYSDNCLR
jgi:hypothetical protein